MQEFFYSLYRKSGIILIASLLTACIPEITEQAEAQPKAKRQDAVMSSFVSLSTPDTSYADILEDCLFTEPCLIDDLPPLGMEYDILEDTTAIIERVWSSQPWMKERFASLLDELPPEYLQLFRPITAIAIAEDIRPSHYWPHTGGIYIDPAFLWLTQQEKETIDPSSDPRIESLTNIPFRVRWRYIGENNTDPFLFHSLALATNRSLDQIFLPFAAMLTHELAHANDYLPPHAYELLNPMMTFQDAVFYGMDTYLHKMRISTILYDRFPINSQLGSSARNYYAGNSKPTNQTATALGYQFAPDAASSFYSYTHKQEDLAMLFEEVMMKAFFQLDRDMAFTEVTHNASCNDYIVRWGTRNRFADPLVRERAEFVATQLFPEYDFKLLFDEVYDSTLLMTNVGWCDSIVTQGQDTGTSANETAFDYDLLYQDLTDGHLHFIPIEPQLSHSH